MFKRFLLGILVVLSGIMAGSKPLQAMFDADIWEEIWQEDEPKANASVNDVNEDHLSCDLIADDQLWEWYENGLESGHPFFEKLFGDDEAFKKLMKLALQAIDSLNPDDVEMFRELAAFTLKLPKSSESLNKRLDEMERESDRLTFLGNVVLASMMYGLSLAFVLR